MKNLIFSSLASHQAHDGWVKQYQPSFPLNSFPLPSQSGMMLMTVLEKRAVSHLLNQPFQEYYGLQGLAVFKSCISLCVS